MKNLTNFSEFSKGFKEKTSTDLFQKQLEGAEKPVEASPEASEVIEPKKSKSVGFSKTRQAIFDKDLTQEGMESFSDCYNVVERRYVSLLKELNRLEFSGNDMKKHVVDLKKAFSELLVKLQYFVEKGGTKEIEE
jgi:hypothetical protein